MTQHSKWQRSTGERSTAQHSTGVGSTAQHSTGVGSTAQQGSAYHTWQGAMDAQARLSVA
jgi:hypothetical protein